MAMPFTHHTVKRSSVRSSQGTADRSHCPEPEKTVVGRDGQERFTLCTGCYEGRSEYLLFLPRRKCRRCAGCADEHLSSSCFLTKCVFCGEDAIAPRREGRALWFACEKHQYFTFQADKWKPLPLSAEERRSIRRQKLRYHANSIRRAFIGLSAVFLLYFLFLRAPLRQHYDFDIVEYADTLWGGATDLVNNVLRFGMDIAQGL